MLQAIKSLAFRYNRYMTYIGRKRAIEVLLNSSDRMLEDAGFSRELLERGVRAWPWKTESGEQTLQAFDFDGLVSFREEHEPQAHDEHQRDNLEVFNSNIDDEASNGRTQFEREEERRVA